MKHRPLISLIHATRGRPQQAVECMLRWQAAAKWPTQIEYIMVMDRDDFDTRHAINAQLSGVSMNWSGDGVLCRVSDGGGSAVAWNEGYKCAAGDLLIQVSDDFHPPTGFDDLLLRRLPEEWQDQPWVIGVSDGHRKDRLMTMLVATKTFCDLEGHFLYPGYKSIWSDGDVSYRAYKRGCVIEARDLVFEHKHPWFDPSVKFDRTYALQNDTIRYAEGEALFVARNPDWKESGVVDWL